MPSKLSRLSKGKTLFEHKSEDNVPTDEDLRKSNSVEVDKNKDGKPLYFLKLSLIAQELAIKDMRKWLKSLTSYVNASNYDADNIESLPDKGEGVKNFYASVNERIDSVEKKLEVVSNKLNETHSLLMEALKEEE